MCPTRKEGQLLSISTKASRERETGLRPNPKDLAQLREKVSGDGKMDSLLWENGCPSRLERFLCQKCFKRRGRHPNKRMEIWTKALSIGKIFINNQRAPKCLTVGDQLSKL